MVTFDSTIIPVILCGTIIARYERYLYDMKPDFFDLPMDSGVTLGINTGPLAGRSSRYAAVRIEWPNIGRKSIQIYYRDENRRFFPQYILLCRELSADYHIRRGFPHWA